jgi:hypothetical protein
VAVSFVPTPSFFPAFLALVIFVDPAPHVIFGTVNASFCDYGCLLEAHYQFAF